MCEAMGAEFLEVLKLKEKKGAALAAAGGDGWAEITGEVRPTCATHRKNIGSKAEGKV